MINRQIVYAVKLAEMGSFRRAAEALNITHAALVNSVRTLEEHYGVRLFDRGRGVKATPTEIGEIFLGRARQIIYLGNDLDYDLQVIKNTGMTNLTIAIGPFPQIIFGQIAVGRMLARFPDLRLKIMIRQFTKVPDLILSRDVNLGIADLNNRSDSAEVDKEPLPHHVAAFFCRPGHPLIGKTDLTISDVLNFPWCTTRLPAQDTSFLPVDLRRAGVIDPIAKEFIPAVEVENLCGFDKYLEQSDVLCGAPLMAYKEELRSSSIAVVPFHQPWMCTNYGFISLKNRYKPRAVQVFMEEVRSIEKVLIEEERELIDTYFPCAKVTAGTV